MIKRKGGGIWEHQRQEQRISIIRQIMISMPKGDKERYMKIARQHDMSLSAYIIQALEEKIEREK